MISMYVCMYLPENIFHQKEVSCTKCPSLFHTLLMIIGHIRINLSTRVESYIHIHIYKHTRKIIDACDTLHPTTSTTTNANLFIPITSHVEFNNTQRKTHAHTVDTNGQTDTLLYTPIHRTSCSVGFSFVRFYLYTRVFLIVIVWFHIGWVSVSILFIVVVVFISAAVFDQLVGCYVCLLDKLLERVSVVMSWRSQLKFVNRENKPGKQKTKQAW